MRTKSQPIRHPGLFRRLFAMIYDALILLVLLLFATALLMPFIKHGIKPGTLFYQLYLVAIIGIFLAWSWVKRGYTIGMLAWGLQIQTQQGQALSWRHALMRMMYAIPSLFLFGFGLVWIWVDPEKLTLYDRLSKTEIIYAPKK